MIPDFRWPRSLLRQVSGASAGSTKRSTISYQRPPAALRRKAPLPPDSIASNRRDRSIEVPTSLRLVSHVVPSTCESD